ncbi:hypothetical protein HPB47_006501 [Ixodes persulcatus]|uniref:Uncharacterized protein n=1 Tax=Ixodes persulcatus TaxID=34615 RepID=A0AC60PA63_IXOPE|nr:hypothetical protein HPB47_006501 [Ixodes persulcatus]
MAQIQLDPRISRAAPRADSGGPGAAESTAGALICFGERLTCCAEPCPQWEGSRERAAREKGIAATGFQGAISQKDMHPAICHSQEDSTKQRPRRKPFKERVHQRSACPRLTLEWPSVYFSEISGPENHCHILGLYVVWL